MIWVRKIFHWVIFVLVGLGCNLTLPDRPPTGFPTMAVLTATASTTVPGSPSARPDPSPTALRTLATTAQLPATTVTTIPTSTVTATQGPLEITACQGGERWVVLVIDPRLVAGIQSGVEQFAQDLCKEGYSVRRRLSSFKDPPELRAYLGEEYVKTGKKLAGAILIGDFPHPYQWVIAQTSNPNLKPTEEETLSLQYYADLNGIFSASPAYRSPGKKTFSFDQHSGDINWEIWIGVLPLYKGDLAKTSDALIRYFVKNHAYRTTGSSLPRRFLEVSEHATPSTSYSESQILADMRSGPYSWQPFSTAGDARFYFNTRTDPYSLDQGYTALSSGAADFAVLDAHGSYRAHGKLPIEWVESKPVGTIFLWSNGCAVGNLDFPDNFLTSALYSPTSAVLVAKGTTNNSGGMGNNQQGFFGANVARALTQKKSFGDALLAHINVPLIQPWAGSREFHFATTVVLGDPTLKIRENLR